jgi:hypothetical protein
VGARWADADLEEVECGQGHAFILKGLRFDH